MSRRNLKWRESASLIILAKDRSTPKKLNDFKALLITRSQKISHLPNFYVFPGGVRENADSSLEWLQHFKNFGIDERKLEELVVDRESYAFPCPDIFKAKDGEGLPRDISLRITAIRETFEEVGVMLCRDRNSFENVSNGYGLAKEDFDRKEWQHRVHNEPKEFLKLCQHLDVVPDLWNLHEWSVWLAPITHRPRFEIISYLVALENTPNIILEANEANNYSWKYPRDYLITRPKSLMMLPQMYELLRMSNFTELEKLKRFAKERANHGTLQILPVDIECADGIACVLPGDSCYPKEPHHAMGVFEVNMTLQKLRESSEKINRFEYTDVYSGRITANTNTKDGHLTPISVQRLAKL